MRRPSVHRWGCSMPSQISSSKLWRSLALNVRCIRTFAEHSTGMALSSNSLVVGGGHSEITLKQEHCESEFKPKMRRRTIGLRLKRLTEVTLLS